MRSYRVLQQKARTVLCNLRRQNVLSWTIAQRIMFPHNESCCSRKMAFFYDDCVVGCSSFVVCAHITATKCHACMQRTPSSTGSSRGVSPVHIQTCTPIRSATFLLVRERRAQMLPKLAKSPIIKHRFHFHCFP